MFNVKINFRVKLAECPENGLPAIDWRKEHGIDPQPTNVVIIGYSGHDEALCREFPQLLNAEGDLLIYNAENSSASDFGLHYSCDAASKELRSNGGYGSHLYNNSLPVELFRELETQRGNGASAQVATILRHLLKQSAEINAQREAERREAERREREACEERKRQYAEAAAKAHAIVAADRAKRNEWIARHGSDRLKRCAAEEIECDAVYRDERLAIERPDWQWTDCCQGDGDEPRNPPAEAFSILDGARQTDPDAVLRYWTVTARDRYHDEDGEEHFYVAVGEFLGREVVYGMPDEYVANKVEAATAE